MSLSRTVLVVSAAAIALGAGTAFILSETTAQDAEILTAQATTEPAATDAPAPSPVVPQRQYLQVDWPAARATAARIQRPRRESMLRQAKERAPMADSLNLPLLLPDDEKIDANLKLYTTHADQYAASSKQDGAIIELIGSRIATIAPPDVAAELAPRRRSAERANGYRIERTEYGVDISFTRFGAAYNISILCDDPYKDERCTKDDYAISLMNSTNVLVPESRMDQQ
jgi:hypothetical protein